MGRKGVSKRKAKKIKPASNENQTGIASTRKGDSSPVQSLINKKSTPLVSNITTNTPAKIKDKSKKANEYKYPALLKFTHGKAVNNEQLCYLPPM